MSMGWSNPETVGSGMLQTGGDRPSPASAAVSRRMSSQRSRDTGAEMAIRRRLHAAGCRYRVHFPVPGLRRRRIDVAFTRVRLAVFIDGCYWHGCPLHCRLPEHNREWWAAKITGNRRRDRDTSERLLAEGWTVLRFWEHTDPDAAVQEVLRALAP